MQIPEVDAWLTIDEVAQQLGVSASKVRRLIEEHALFAIRVEKEPKVPAHLIQNGEPLSSIRGTMFLLLDNGLSEQEAIEWIYAENENLGNRPIDSLLQGHKAPVRRAAQTLG
ncbi:MAG: excisionase family DNA-binding protein [Aquiluna sp.]|nr:excisionase family DNA-binding protein [Aquiluna sp.]MCF8544949.1 excisionase family DNA-binding protein [Aquiluna sp.]